MGERDCSALRSVQALIDREMPAALDKFYAQIRRSPRTRGFFSSETQIDHAKHAQETHWKRISSARFDNEYVNKVRGIGSVHARIGLEPSPYIGGYGIILDHLLHSVIGDLLSGGFLSRTSSRTARNVADVVGSLCKAVLVEIDLTVSSYMDDINKARLAMQAEQDRRAEEDRAVIETIGNALTALAKGDLTHRIEGDGIPERLHALKQHFNQTAETLEHSLGNIAVNAGDIVVNADGIRQGAENLSRRSEQQAATQEEMSAALGQITQRVTRTAEETRKADQMANMARSDAEHAGSVVHGTIAAIAEIEKSSREMAGIIGIINEISFQTNILALNASVEAARAGSVGRGFAVVASEVRALAQRSADAGREISALINLSGGQVKSGVALVHEAGEALQRIMSQVMQINDVVTTISASTQEQSASISQLNIAMGGLEQTTQKNAIVAEQSASAVRNLVATSDELTRMVAGFTLSGRDSRATPARKKPKLALIHTD
ncbi:globin-coupled sensor protein [Gluconacetobacter takamatsuzukensis]|uniref:Globin-coupled sensor protein n=2 Tax=Gluconacetobacter takamatsuzukensis TaxID=1286190 RepID=A0A7W4KEG9_9PROT|nr:globin-coupled sensor protein [Gluconacetobacter takamatsuzukensis]